MANSKPVPLLIRNQLDKLQVRCPHAQDHGPFRRSELPAHLAWCPHAPALCRNEYQGDMCGRRLLRSELVAHLAVCELRAVRCEGGCGAELSVRASATHSCVAQLRAESDGLRQARTALKQDFAALEKAHAALEKAHAALQAQYTALASEHAQCARRADAQAGAAAAAAAAAARAGGGESSGQGSDSKNSSLRTPNTGSSSSPASGGRAHNLVIMARVRPVRCLGGCGVPVCLGDSICSACHNCLRCCRGQPCTPIERQPECATQ